MKTLKEVEREHVTNMVEELGGDKKAIAQALGISLKTLYNKLDKFGISIKKVHKFEVTTREDPTQE